MTKRLIIFAVVGVLLAGAGFVALKQRSQTPEARREDLLREFIAVIPDSLGDDQFKEIEDLVTLLWAKADDGWVYPEDLAEVESEMKRAVDNRYIGGRNLVVLMAKVGYYTYRGRDEYNLPDGEVDHPELNPDAAPYTIGSDSAVWAEFEIWKAQMLKEGKIDTTTGLYDPFFGMEKKEAPERGEKKSE